jgi:hypothetical protein
MSDETVPAWDVRAWERKAIIGLLGLLIAAFGFWAQVVREGTQQLIAEVGSVRAELIKRDAAHAEYQRLMERRITILEQRDQYIIQALTSLHDGVAVPKGGHDE